MNLRADTATLEQVYTWCMSTGATYNAEDNTITFIEVNYDK